MKIEHNGRAKRERLATQQCESRPIAASCAELDERYGGTHTIGPAGQRVQTSYCVVICNFVSNV